MPSNDVLKIDISPRLAIQAPNINCVRLFELDEEAKGGLLARLAEDEGLRKRYEELRDAGVLIGASLDALRKATIRKCAAS